MKHVETAEGTTSGIILADLQPDTEYEFKIGARFAHDDPFELQSEVISIRTPHAGMLMNYA
jgi:hypothetical protein